MRPRSAAEPPAPRPARIAVLGVGVDAIDAETAAARILDWAAAHEARSVCLCNVHAVITAQQDAGLHQALQRADLVLPDGAPVAWMQRRLGAQGQRRIAGPDLTALLVDRAAERGVPVFLFGSTDATLVKLQHALRRRQPRLVLAGAVAPPFREPTADETAAHLAAIDRSGAGLVFVGLGCPKQERWMAAQAGSVPAVLVGVGAAFDFLAGTKPRAPRWMQSAGLEWLHRLVHEPRRLAPRYIATNTRFVLGAARQWLGGR